MKFGYARVSTKEQNEARQIEALKEWGVNEKEILIDKASGFEKTRRNSNRNEPENSQI